MSIRDLIIVGAGPSGLSAAIAARQRGLDYLVLEQGVLVNSIYRFPPQMVFFTTPELLEIGGLPFVSPYEKPTRAEALKYYRRVVDTYDLHIGFEEKVSGKSYRMYSDRRWLNPFADGTPANPTGTLNLAWENVAGRYTDLDQRIWMFTDYYSLSPGMVSQTPGLGARYLIAFTDRHIQRIVVVQVEAGWPIWPLGSHARWQCIDQRPPGPAGGRSGHVHATETV